MCCGVCAYTPISVLGKSQQRVRRGRRVLGNVQTDSTVNGPVRHEIQLRGIGGSPRFADPREEAPKAKYSNRERWPNREDDHPRMNGTEFSVPLRKRVRIRWGWHGRVSRRSDDEGQGRPGQGVASLRSTIASRVGPMRCAQSLRPSSPRRSRQTAVHWRRRGQRGKQARDSGDLGAVSDARCGVEGAVAARGRGARR